MAKTYEQDPDYVKGAGVYEEKLGEQGIPKDAWGSYGKNINPNEYDRIVTGFQSQGDPYSADNVQQATTAPVQAPDYSDPLNMREGIYGELGVPGLREEVAGIEGRLGEFDVETRALGQDISGRQVSMSKITGITDQAMRQRALGRVAIAEELEAKANLLASALGEAQTRFGLAMDQRSQMQQLMLQAPGAGIKFSDDWESAVGKMDSWNEEREDEAREQSKKDSFDALYMQTFGTDRGKMSRREAGKRLEGHYGSERAYEEQMRSLSLASSRKSLAGGSGSSMTQTEKKARSHNEIYQDMTKFRDMQAEKAAKDGKYWDGFVDPNDWEPLLQAWIKKGGDAQEFINRYSGTVEEDAKGNTIRKDGFISPRDALRI